MDKITQLVVEAADKNQLRLYHSQPQPREYSTIVKAKRLIGANQIQLAFVDAVVAKARK